MSVEGVGLRVQGVGLMVEGVGLRVTGVGMRCKGVEEGRASERCQREEAQPERCDETRCHVHARQLVEGTGLCFCVMR